MPKKLYAVKDRQTKKLASAIWYDNKMIAKTERNKLNGPRPDDFVEGTAERFFLTSKWYS